MANRVKLRRPRRQAETLTSAKMKPEAIPMPEPAVLATSRLRLRPWRTSDLEPFAAINADSVVMRYFPSTLTRSESDELAQRIMAHFDEHGYGFWAVDVLDGPEFIGFVGLQNGPPYLPFAPAVEIGWRLAAAHHGHGYATEAASAALAYGFDTLVLDEIVAYTGPNNAPSRNVMRKLGMCRDAASEFSHPRLPRNDPNSRHVLYRIRRAP